MKWLSFYTIALTSVIYASYAPAVLAASLCLYFPITKPARPFVLQEYITSNKTKFLFANYYLSRVDSIFSFFGVMPP